MTSIQNNQNISSITNRLDSSITTPLDVRSAPKPEEVKSTTSLEVDGFEFSSDALRLATEANKDEDVVQTFSAPNDPPSDPGPDL